MYPEPINPSTPLGELRQRILAEREASVPLPTRLGGLVRRHGNAMDKRWEVSDVVVTSDGRIATAQETRGDVTVSRVTTQIFAAVPWDEEALVRKHLPANATRHGHGWAYTIASEFGDTFELFLYHDDIERQYRVKLIAPSVEQLGDAHRTHIYSDGNLCLSPGVGGQQMLNNAYAESVLWCNGVSALALGHPWLWGDAS